MDLGQALVGGASGPDRVDRILSLVNRFKEVDAAIGTIRYDNNLVVEIPDVLKTLGDEKDAIIAKLKTV